MGCSRGRRVTAPALPPTGRAIVVNQKTPGFQLHVWGNGSWQEATAIGTMAASPWRVGEGYPSDGTTGLVLERDLQG